MYAHPKEELDTQTPAVAELGLTFEPCLVLVGGDGRVVERLDTIYDEVGGRRGTCPPDVMPPVTSQWWGPRSSSERLEPGLHVRTDADPAQHAPLLAADARRRALRDAASKPNGSSRSAARSRRSMPSASTASAP